MANKILFNSDRQQDVNDKIRSGISQLADAVKITLGPTGKVVMYEREFGDPAITKDGVTVAKQINLQDPMENMAASMVRQAAAKTASTAGDGTTTATIYTQAIYEGGIKYIKYGVNAQEVKRGIDHAVSLIVREFFQKAKPIINIDQVRQVAMCSANQDEEIGGMIADAMDKVGTDGVITIEEGQSLDTTVSVINGLQFPRGYMSPQFANSQDNMECEYEDPNILITDQRIGDLKTLLSILEMAVKKLKGPLIIISDELSDDCLGALVLNKIKGNLSIAAVKAPDFGNRRRDALEDIAIATGGTLITKDGVSFNDVTPAHLGKCKKIRIDRDTTTIIEGSGNEDEIDKRINLIKSQYERVVGDFDKERLQERLARLTGGIAQITVGGATETEVREKKDRIDDALHACKAAIDEGILPGGGVAALHAAEILSYASAPSDDYLAGIKIVREALEAPIRQIAINTGEDPGRIIHCIKTHDDVKSGHIGFDAQNKKVCDMISSGVIVPAKVERSALQNAGSIASMLLNTDCMISIIKESQEAQPPQSPYNYM